MYLNYVRTLRFDEKPDYNYLRRLFRELFQKKNYAYDYIFDWSARRMSKEEQENKPTQESKNNQQEPVSNPVSTSNNFKSPLNNKVQTNNLIQRSPNMHYQTLASPSNTKTNTIYDKTRR